MIERHFGLHGATMGSGGLLEDLAAAQGAGYSALEIRASKLEAYLAEGGTLRALRTAFARAGVGALSLLDGPDAWEAGAQAECSWRWGRWEQLCARAAAIGCPTVVALPESRGGFPGGGAIEPGVVTRVREMARMAAMHGVRVALELRGPQGSPVVTLAAVREIIDNIADQRVGLVLDAFHFYTGRSTWAMLDDMDPEQVHIVRLEDSEPLPLDELTDAHRLLPGDGVIPLRELVRRLEGIGYHGIYSIELYRPEYWDWEPLRLARAARESLEALCAELDEREGRLDYA